MLVLHLEKNYTITIKFVNFGKTEIIYKNNIGKTDKTSKNNIGKTRKGVF